MRRDFVPAPTDILCERCGYLLNGLPPDANCPECGLPVAESTTQSPRRPPAWESGTDRPAARFAATARFALSAPRRFFRTVTAHGDAVRSRRFGLIAVAPGALLTCKALLMHVAAMNLVTDWPGWALFPLLVVVVLIATPGAWLGLDLAVVRLTSWEAGYWGFRLPPGVVRRALHYLAPHVTAAVTLPWAITLVYLCMALGSRNAGNYLTLYLYTLSAAVVISAVYLFGVYVTAMKSLMYANR